jgi:hypothetical protein
MATTGRSIHVVGIEGAGQEIELSGYTETIKRVLDEMMEKVAERARQNAPAGDRSLYTASEGPFKDSINVIPAKEETEGEDIIEAGVGSDSGHGPTEEYGSGMFNRNKYQSRSEKYKAHRPYTAGRSRLTVVPNGEYLIAPSAARVLALPLDLFKTPASGMDPGEIYRRSHDRHGNPYISFKTGQPIIFSMWAMNPGQQAKGVIRKAMNAFAPGIRSRLRSEIAKNTHMKFKEIKVVIEMTGW